MDKESTLPLLIALGVIFVTAVVIYVIFLPVLCRMFTASTIFC